MEQIGGSLQSNRFGEQIPVSAAKKKGEESPAAGAQDSVHIAGGKPKEIHIIHINDIHGNIEPQQDKAFSPSGQVGGLSYMGSTVKRLRAEHPDSLLLNAGDVAQGSFESDLSQGRPIFEVLNYLKFDALELGNHDFGMGRVALSQMLHKLESPILGANIRSTETSETIEGVRPSMLKEIGGVKVGIIGVDTPKVPEYVRPEEIAGMTFPKPDEIVKTQLAQLKEDGAHIIILLSHLGQKDDTALAEKVPGIDIIVGGHDHNALPEGVKVGDTIIVQAGCNNQYVGDLCISVDESTKKITGCKSTLIPIVTDQIKPDPAIDDIIRPYMEESRKKGSETLGSVSGAMRYSYKEITPQGQHLADAMREAAGTELAIVSGKMLRAGFKGGPITKKELFNSYPNNEFLVRLKLRGTHIKEELEKRYADDSRAVMLPSGFSFTVDKSLPNGERITSITVDGHPMDMEQEYSVAVSDNQARYETFKTARDVEDLGLLRDTWSTYVTAHSPLSNELDGRVIFA